MAVNYGWAVVVGHDLCADGRGEFVWRTKRQAKVARDFYEYGKVVRVKVTTVGKKNSNANRRNGNVT